METINFYMTFDGFYNSIYESIIDNVINSDIESGHLTEDQALNINYKPIYLALSENIFDCIEEVFNDEYSLFTENGFLNFDGLSSPKFYNFSTDKIEASISYDNYLVVYNYFIKHEDFLSYVDENAQSRPGFHSFYNGIDEVKKDPSIFMTYIFKFIHSELYDEIIQQSTDLAHEIILNNLEY